MDLRGLLISTSPLYNSIVSITPKAMRKFIVYFVHMNDLSSHPGSSRIYKTLRRSYYRRSMIGDIQNYIAVVRHTFGSKEHV